MTGRKILSTLTLGLLSATAILASGSIFASNSETVLRDSFSVALNGAPSVHDRVAKNIPVAGSEEYWLTSMRPDGSLPVTKVVAIGDRIGLSVRGHSRELEVASVAEFAPNITEIDTRARQTKFVLVTAKDTGDKDSLPIRFVMEIDQNSPDVTAQGPRVL